MKNENYLDTDACISIPSFNFQRLFKMELQIIFNVASYPQCQRIRSFGRYLALHIHLNLLRNI